MFQIRIENFDTSEITVQSCHSMTDVLKMLYDNPTYRNFRVCHKSRKVLIAVNEDTHLITVYPRQQEDRIDIAPSWSDAIA